jgi:hypothetical protein
MSVAYAFLTIPDILEILRQPHTLATSNSIRDANYIQSFATRDILAAFRSTISGSGNLLGLAVMVELLDRIYRAVSAKVSNTTS